MPTITASIDITDAEAERLRDAADHIPMEVQALIDLAFEDGMDEMLIGFAIRNPRPKPPPLTPMPSPDSQDDGIPF